MDDVQLRRHSTAPRVLILDILEAQNNLDREQILAEWTARRPELTPAHMRQLPRMLSEIIWRLTNLGWITEADGGFSVTEVGHRALRLARARD